MKVSALIVVATLIVAAAASAQERSDAERHPSLGVGALQLELLARVQLDARFPERQGDDEDDEERDLDIARRRVGVRGRLTRVAAFEVEAEVATPDPWRDVYVDYRQFRAIRVRAGHFKVPFSLDYTTSSANLDVIDRARAADRLSVGRERGVMAHGRLWDERLKYEVGAFGGRTTAVRVTGRPLGGGRSPIGPLSTAVAFTTGTIDERRVESVWVNGTRHRAGLEVRWEPGPLTVTAEYMRATDQRRGQGLAGDDLSPLVRTGWYLTSTWAVVPEARGSRPRLELAARVDALRVGSGGPGAEASFSPRALVVAGRDERAVTLGLNWYVVSRVKLQVNAVHDRANTARARWMPLARLQVSL